MVACHNFDLNAARGVGYRTCFVRRPDEWGVAGPPDPTPHPATDLVVDSFSELARQDGHLNAAVRLPPAIPPQPAACAAAQAP